MDLDYSYSSLVILSIFIVALIIKLTLKKDLGLSWIKAICYLGMGAMLLIQFYPALLGLTITQPDLLNVQVGRYTTVIAFTEFFYYIGEGKQVGTKLDIAYFLVSSILLLFFGVFFVFL